MATSQPHVGCVLIIRNKSSKRVAFLLRQNTRWMNGYYGAPGGKIEKGESFIESAIREAKEEVNILIKPENLRFVHVLHLNIPDEWMHIVFEVVDYEGEPSNAEPSVHGELAWLDPLNLPENVLPSNKAIFEQVRKGNFYSEITNDQ